jgi:hypothetical protein
MESENWTSFTCPNPWLSLGFEIIEDIYGGSSKTLNLHAIICIILKY